MKCPICGMTGNRLGREFSHTRLNDHIREKHPDKWQPTGNERHHRKQSSLPELSKINMT